MSPFTPLNADSAAFDDQVDVKAESEASTLVKVEGSGSGGEEAVDDGLTTGNNMVSLLSLWTSSSLETLR